MKRLTIFALSILMLLTTIGVSHALFWEADEITTAGTFLGRLDMVPVNSIGDGKLEMVVGLRESNGDLKLKEYRLIPDGGLFQLDHWVDNDESGESLEIAMDSFSPANDRFVTAVRTGSDRLKVVAWEAHGADITRLGDSGNFGPLVNDVSVTMVSPSRVVAAYRTSANQLGLRAWDIVDTGVDSVDFQLTDTFFSNNSVFDIDVDLVPFTDYVFVATRNGGSDLQVYTFHIDNVGDIQQIDTETTGEIFEVRVRGTAMSPALNNTAGAVTVARNGDGNLHLSKWDVANNGSISWASNNFTSNYPTGGAMNVAVTKHDYITTAFRNASGKLQVIQWSLANDELARGDDITLDDTDLSLFGHVSISWVEFGGDDYMAVASQLDTNQLRMTLIRDP